MSAIIGGVIGPTDVGQSPVATAGRGWCALVHLPVPRHVDVARGRRQRGVGSGGRQRELPDVLANVDHAVRWLARPSLITRVLLV